uniref:Uncharacterized protein n=1 Tax=Glossina austeni TaxID=7395 RepID=A0A1A9UNS8_GLOAU
MQLTKQLTQRVNTLPLRRLTPTNGLSLQFQGDNHLLLLVFTAQKCAHLAQSSAEALKLPVDLYQETVDDTVQTKQEPRITNYLLMQIGLLLCEERDITGLLSPTFKFPGIWSTTYCRS